METHILYSGQFSVDFIVGNTTYNTWSTWGLVPVVKPVPAPPSISADGNVTAGRSSWRFRMTHGATALHTVFANILAAINGKSGTVKLYEDSGYQNGIRYAQYTGRMSVTGYEADEDGSYITIEAELLSSADETALINNYASRYAVSFNITGSSTYNTYTTWHLKPVGIPFPLPARPRTNYVVVPAANGAIDLSEAVAGTIRYDNSEGSWGFVLLEGYDPTTIYSSIVAAINGKAGTATMNGISRSGRFSVDQPESSESGVKFNIGYILYP